MHYLTKIYPWAFLGAILMLIVFNAFYELSIPRLIPAPGKDIVIEKGESLKKVAQDLGQADIIGSNFYLSSYMRVKGYQAKPGNYHFEGNYSILDIAEELNHGGAIITLTVPDGMTVKDIEDLLNKNGLKIDFDDLKLSDFSDLSLDQIFGNVKLEGFLFPDTYKFFGDETNKDVTRKFLTNFRTKALPRFSDSQNPYKTLIIASLLEKEVKTDDEKQIVAGIIQKRISLGMPLQIDAPLVYIKCAGAYVSCANRTLTTKDLNMDSPFNTYKVLGLPPAPIGNPGFSSIDAALNPRASKYLYHYSTPDGKTIFSATLEEHNAVVSKYTK